MFRSQQDIESGVIGIAHHRQLVRTILTLEAPDPLPDRAWKRGLP
jgi:hypothetical protein